MSKYTTEVRYICEVAYGLTGEEETRPSVDTIIDGARSSIFNFDYPIFDEAYRPILEKKILKHYYTREIGEETVELWKLRLNAMLNEIMPYYNKLYLSELMVFNPLYTSDLHKEGVKHNTEESEGEFATSGTSSGTSNNTRTDNTTSTHTTDQWNLYSDTPQGGIAGISGAEDDPSLGDNAYLTNATHIIGGLGNAVHNTGTVGNSGTTSGNTTGTGTNAGTVQNDGDYAEHIYGYHGYNPNILLRDFRANLLNIDLEIINKLRKLFFNLW